MADRNQTILPAGKVNCATGIGGVTLRFTARHTGCVSLLLDDPQGAPAAQWTLPAANAPRDLLLPVAVSGEHEAYFLIGEGVTLKTWQFHPADVVVVGQNPLTGMDFPDVDVIRVGDTYYMISTTMYFMPGGVILRSYDLINWEYCTRIYDVLDDTPRQRLEEGNAYGAGMWAATLRWHKGTFYVIFVANDTRKTYLFRAENIEGPWRRSLIEGFYHDCSLLFDDDDRVYLTYGNKEIRLIELNAELTGPKEGGLNRVIADYGDSDYLGYEGSHLYKINGNYYLFLIHSRKDRWRRVETCLMSHSLTGDFRGGIVMDDDMGLRDDGVAQGGIVDTPDGRWYAILFQDTGAAGRIPVLMPMAWENDFPVMGINGKIPYTVCNLTTRPGYSYAPLWASDDFTSSVLKDVWEWNHIPQLDLVQMGEGALRLRTGAVSPSLTRTRNILTQRAMLPGCQAEVELDASALRDGDIAGLCVLQSRWGFIGLKKEKGAYVLIVRTRCEGDPEEGVERAVMNWPSPEVRLRAEMRFGPDCDTAAFAYWTEDGWKAMGEVHPIAFLLDHFTGNRFGLFAQSLIQPGGEAAFRNFVLEPQE